MFPLLQALISGVIGPVIGPLFSFLGKKQDTTLDGFKTASGFDLDAYKAYLASEAQANVLRTQSNQWLGARIIAFAAGELTVLYFGSIVFDSIFHTGWAIAKLPAPWDTYAWTILQSFIIVSPIAPIATATAAWLNRK
jgi:hypothetical protein